jgi:hypothetical protein
LDIVSVRLQESLLYLSRFDDLFGRGRWRNWGHDNRW